jgi:glycosyltransferase involved in cell wall biosynthesis
MASLNICELNMPIEYYTPVSGGAVSTVIMQRAKHLIAMGHEVTIVAVDNGDPMYDVGHVIPLPMPRRESFNKVQRALAHFQNRFNYWEWPYYGHYIRHFSQALANLKPVPDVIITHNDMIASRFVKKVLPNTPVISWLHNEQYRPASDIMATIATTDLFVGVSEYIRNWTANQYPGLAHKIEALHNGIDLETFFPAPHFLETSAPLKILFVGRTSADKGPDLAADAVWQLKNEGIPLHFTVAGSTWWHGVNDMEEPFFRDLKVKMDRAQANYHGQVPRPQVPDLMRDHDVVCVISRFNDPCPLVALEAMGAGCVVLASQRGGLPEICGDAALYVDPDQPDTVARALRELATDAARLRHHKQKSVDRAAGLSWQRHAQVLAARSQSLP